MHTSNLEPSSFRDSSGFLFYHDRVLCCQINQAYRENYERLMGSGLYEKLASNGMLIPHRSRDDVPSAYHEDKACKTIEPEKILFISYPYEWSFSQLKQVALTVLEIQQIAMDFGMTLKDSSVYNIQFRDCKPILIYTGSFEMYIEGNIWNACRQFCSYFLAPLALMTHRDIRLNQLLKKYIDEIPLDMTSSLLPTKMLFSYSLLAHIHAHAKSQKHYGDKKSQITKRKLSKNQFMGLVASLHSGIKKLNWSPKGTKWADYYDATNYSERGFEGKKDIISDWLDNISSSPSVVWDLGANIGIFSRIATSKELFTASFDIDPVAVEQNFLHAQKNNDTNILPLLLDLANPSPNPGWANSERQSFLDQKSADVVMALALVRHLAIGNSLQLPKIASFLHTITQFLIIEFVPKTDSQVKRLLANRQDIFDDYTLEIFEDSFGAFFNTHEKIRIADSERTMYMMEKVAIPT